MKILIMARKSQNWYNFIENLKFFIETGIRDTEFLQL